MLALERNRLDPCFWLLRAGADARDVARQLRLSADAEADEALERQLARARESSQPGNPRPEVPAAEYAAAFAKLCRLVRSRVFLAPSSLVDLAKFAIRKRLGGDVERKAASLPLPAPLRTLVVDIFEEEEATMGQNQVILRH